MSWMIPPLGFDEHPSSAPANGMWFTSLVLDALTSNANVWSKTAFFLMYDENDGWFDHTSQLKLVSERFGVDVPNVSAWRQATVGDLTSTMFQSPANTAVPSLPATSVVMPLTGTCSEFSQDTETGGAAPTVPTKQTMPTQGGGTQPAGDYYYPGAGEQGSGVADGHRTTIGTAGSSLTTTKSAYNQLAKR
jgi:phospholipase C